MTMATTDSFHKSNYGSFGGGFRADMDGYVHLTAEAVLGGNWDAMGGDMGEEMAEEIAEHNVAAMEKADAGLEEWRNSNT